MIEIITMHLNIILCFWTLVLCCGLTFETPIIFDQQAVHRGIIYLVKITKLLRYSTVHLLIDINLKYINETNNVKR